MTLEAAALLLLILVPSAAMAEQISLVSPLDWQVFQRANRLHGKVLVQGRAPGSEKVEVRFTGQSIAGNLPGKWGKVKTNHDGSFRTKIDVASGGWYSCEVRATVKDAALSSVSVGHVGVGEVFVVVGQSNATNWGSERQKPSSGMVSAASDDGRWQPADDPQPGAHDRSSGGSFIPTFGDELYNNLKVPIGVASLGHGATSVRQWLPKGTDIEIHPTLDDFIITTQGGKWQCDGTLFDYMMKFIHRLGPNGFRAVMWHQGESDAGQARAGYPVERQLSGKQYTELMKQLISAVPKDAEWKIPWFVAQATYHSEQDASDEEFRAAQKALWTAGVALQGPDTDSLRSGYRDGVHFNAQGLKAHGRMWAECVLPWLKKKL